MTSTKWTERYNFLRFWLQVIGITLGAIIWLGVVGFISILVFA